MMEVKQGQDFLRNYILKNRREKMDCFVSIEQFSEIEFLLQPMFHIQKQSVQESISGGVYFSEVTSLYCTIVTRKEILRVTKVTKGNFLNFLFM